MKKSIAIIAMSLLLAATTSLAQWSNPPASQSPPQPMYDNSYRGPMNVYGQPVYSTGPRQDNAQAGQAPNEGLIPMAASGLGALGKYMWGYLPAPVRGEEPQYLPPPGSGFVVRQVVPGIN